MCSALPHLQRSTRITEALLPELEAWCAPRGSRGYTLHKRGLEGLAGSSEGQVSRIDVLALERSQDPDVCSAFRSKQSARLWQNEHHVQGDHWLEE